MLMRLKLLFLVILLAAFSSLTQADDVKYYRQLVFRESPVEDVKGRLEIDANVAAKVLHYRFHYDSQGRLTEVSRRLGAVLSRNIGSFPGFFWFAPKLAIRYEGNKEIRTFYDETDTAIAAHGAVKTMVFTLDDQRRRVKLENFDEHSAAVNSDWGIHRYEWQHPKKGTVIEKRFSLDGKPVTMRPDLLFHTIRMEFGEDDMLQFVLNIDEKGELVNNADGAAIDRIVYDDQNNFLRWQVYDANRRSVDGNEPKMAIGEYQYDAMGQSRSLRGFNTQGQNGVFSWGFHAMKMAYDSFGNIKSQMLFDDKGNRLSSTQFEFSVDGLRVTWIKQFDAHGKPDGSRGFFALQPQYDNKGRRVGMKRFDVNLQEIRPAS